MMSNIEPSKGISKEVLSSGERYLQIRDEIEALELEKKELSKKIDIGTIVEYNGSNYEWISYNRTSTAWKGLYTSAFGHLDDESQVIMGEMERKGTKSSTFNKFEKR